MPSEGRVLLYVPILEKVFQELDPNHSKQARWLPDARPRAAAPPP